ncbi:MerC domain-containing protein [Psychrosphaera sp. G1-22]|uniref:MerC domain-containing protein n=1 Tax=Psychrosphaera algicola TaxID=3023714 RepID=A0ABT5FDI7_9GAMM|nr:MerC domain-containing protein [Psychrosphaera sp. G1-22]MDC2888913.1 MerC domain-containing protein [Psychrosphaera sp. G1-22]
MLLPVIVILAVSIPRAYRTHKNPQPAMVGVVGILTLIFGVTIGEHVETWFTVVGSILVISSHLLNRQSLKRTSISMAQLAQ